MPRIGSLHFRGYSIASILTNKNNPEAPTLPKSQRDSITQPRVARHLNTMTRPSAWQMEATAENGASP